MELYEIGKNITYDLKDFSLKDKPTIIDEALKAKDLPPANEIVDFADFFTDQSKNFNTWKEWFLVKMGYLCR